MMIYAVVLARYLGPEDYGYYAAGYSLVGLWSFFISAGMDTWFLQKIKNQEQTKILSGEILKFKFLLLFIWGAVLVFGISRLSFVAEEFIIICVLDIWFDSSLLTLIYSLNIQQNYLKVAGILTISRLGRLISALCLIGLGFRNPILFAMSRMFFTIIGFLIAFDAIKPIINPNQIGFKKIPCKELVPFGLSEMLAQVYIMADVSLLSVLTGQIQVGFYSPATNILSALFVIPNSMYLYLLPRFSKKIAIQNRIPDKEVFITILGFGLVGLMLYGFIAFSAEWLIPIILGKAYVQTKQLLLNLSPIIIFKSLQFGLVTILVSAGLQKFRLLPQLVAAILNVILNLFFIPRMGAGGAVLAYNLSELTLLFGYGFIVYANQKPRLKNG